MSVRRNLLPNHQTVAVRLTDVEMHVLEWMIRDIDATPATFLRELFRVEYRRRQEAKEAQTRAHRVLRQASRE